MRFLMVRSDQVRGDTVHFTPDQCHYLARVLRRGPGDAVSVVLAGEAYLEGVLVGGHRGSLTATIQRRQPVPPPPRPALSLAIGLLKGAKLEDIIREVTELGLGRVIPLQCTRAVSRWPETAHRLDRLTDLTIGACQQSGNTHPPVVEAPVSVEQLIVRAQLDQTGLVMAVAAGGKGFGELTVAPGADQILLVGPEGDFTPEEQQRVRDSGGYLLTLTGNVLRAETACLALSTLMLGKMGRFG